MEVHIKGFLKFGIFLVFIGISIFKVDMVTFDMDEMIITENISLPFSVYFDTNSSYGPYLKISHWFSENFLGGGPATWRVISLLSYLGLCYFIFQFFSNRKLNYLAVACLMLIAILHYPNHYARWGMTAYMLSTFLLFLSFYYLYRQQCKLPSIPKLALFSIAVISLLGFVYVGEMIGFFALLCSYVLMHLVARNRAQYISYLAAALVSGFGIILITYLYSNYIGQGLEPRTSIKRFYYPLSNIESEWIFFIKGFKNIFQQGFKVQHFLSLYTLLFVGASIFLCCFLQAQKKADDLKRIIKVLALWGVVSILSLYILSLLGKAPYGDVRYSKVLIWLLPVLACCGLTLVFQKALYVLNIGALGERQLQTLRVLWAAVSTVALIQLCYEVTDYRAKQYQGFKSLEKAITQNADLYIVDELHKFSFDYLNPNKPKVVMSRGYPCENGKFWNAYGWNNCEDMLTKVSEQSKAKILSENVKKIVLVSRGPFNRKYYSNWFDVVIEQGEFKPSKATRYSGPYVYSLTKR